MCKRMSDFKIAQDFGISLEISKYARFYRVADPSESGHCFSAQLFSVCNIISLIAVSCSQNDHH